MKFGRPEIGKVVRYLPDKKIGSRSRSRFCADRAQNLSGIAPNNILGVPQISSKSVHFRRSYSRTREHRSNGPQSVCNTRRSFSFFAEYLILQTNFTQCLRKSCIQYKMLSILQHNVTIRIYLNKTAMGRLSLHECTCQLDINDNMYTCVAYLTNHSEWNV